MLRHLAVKGDGVIVHGDVARLDFASIGALTEYRKIADGPILRRNGPCLSHIPQAIR